MRPLGAALGIWLCAAVSALAQDAVRMPVVGLMRTGAAANNEPFGTLFRDALAARGYAEGRDLRLDYRFADGDAQTPKRVVYYRMGQISRTCSGSRPTTSTRS